jgi:hypothetical protein
MEFGIFKKKNHGTNQQWVLVHPIRGCRKQLWLEQLVTEFTMARPQAQLADRMFGNNNVNYKCGGT